MIPTLSKIDRVTYTPHIKKHSPPVSTFEPIGPPSSPPINILLRVKITNTATEQTKNTNTVNPNLPAGTSYVVSWANAYWAQMTHGCPSPKKILTEFEPVTLPTAESAYSEP